MASTFSRKPSNTPLITVVGATGTGKSQLAVELAKRFNGEVVNGDAMQLYAGLPIITNKITEAEQQGIPHHLIGTIGLDESPWVVSTFVQKALSTIDEIASRGRLPILVGGTHYYTQSLLFNDALAQVEQPEADVRKEQLVSSPEEQWPVLAQSTEDLLEELRRIDPVMAARWHPNDRRKIQRSLMIYLQTGRRASDIYLEQKSRKRQASTSDMHHLRFSKTLLFWVHAEKEALRARLDTRVDKMLENGLLDEVQHLHDHVSAHADTVQAVDETRGIWVSIGFKEFRPYYEASRSNEGADVLARAKADSIEKTKIATRQYAKGQVRWIRLRLGRALKEVHPKAPLYLLDGTELDNFDDAVVQPAIRLADQFLHDQELPPPETICPAAADVLGALDNPDAASLSDRLVVQHCDVCNVSCATESQWLSHTKSKVHRKLVSKARTPGKALQHKASVTDVVDSAPV